MKHRTAIITAASIAVVMAAATAAIATNLGILDTATASSEVGTLTIETIETIPPTTMTMAETPPAEIVVVEDTPATESVANGELAAYAVGDAGIVTLNKDGTILTIDDIEANPGWATAEVVEDPSIDIRFASSDGGSLQFTAHLDDGRDIVTAVNDLAAPAVIVVTETVYEDDAPITNASGTSGQDGSAFASSSDSHDDDEEDEEEDEEDDEEEDDEEDEEDEDDDEDD